MIATRFDGDRIATTPKLLWHETLSMKAPQEPGDVGTRSIARTRQRCTKVRRGGRIDRAMLYLVIVRIDPSGTSLDELLDFKRFHVSVTDPELDVASALSRDRIGTVGADGDARLSIGGVRTLAMRQIPDSSARDQWNSEFERMLAYAASKGWVDEDGTTIQAHIER